MAAHQVAKTKALLDTLLDFKSAKGEALRAQQRKEGQRINGTLRDDSDALDLQRRGASPTLPRHFLDTSSTLRRC